MKINKYSVILSLQTMIATAESEEEILSDSEDVTYHLRFILL